MRERVRAQGGKFAIAPASPSGTIICIKLPVPSPDSKVERIGELIETAQ
jgi:hypothetical protein